MPHHYVSNLFFNLKDPSQFTKGLQHAVNHIEGGDTGIFASDNLFTYHKNLSFLEDATLMRSFEKNATSNVERGILWRTSILLWGARNGMRLHGDFVEGGCFKGTSVRVICDALDFASSNKRYFLYDLFQHDESMALHSAPEHGTELFSFVVERFSDTPNVVVTQGSVPDILAQVAPDKIAFMHLDMNNVSAEVGALEVLFDRMVPGALLVLDDYGWAYYRDQKLAEDAWLAKRGYHVVELPTGQGLVIK